MIYRYIEYYGGMELKILSAIDEVERSDWNRIAAHGHPFLRYEFLAALERNACVGAQHGWLPRYLTAFDADGQLAGAVPLYIKNNSYGEFVFDWAWADAWQRHGLQYYPKAVVAIPYTPATGPRILIADRADRENIATQLIELALAWCEDENLSSLHWLFTNEQDTRRLAEHDLILRLGCQFHWKNNGYRDFADLLDGFTSRKRKKVLRERRQVRDAGIRIDCIHGSEANELQLRTMYEFYCSTFEKKSGYPTFTLEFFREIASSMGDQLVFFIASLEQRIVAGSICLRNHDTLYGRHWGCRENYHSLHFEACYYQGIDYCIKHGLEYFEPGAQGEHKISRGFLPAPTWSAHWIAHTGFREIIRRHLEQETAAMREYMTELSTRSPYKQAETA